MGYGEHTDYGMFTLIWSEKVPETLQIQTGPTCTNTKGGQEWTFIAWLLQLVIHYWIVFFLLH
jgi:isopenicillin N synthase-like dioxygenase